MWDSWLTTYATYRTKWPIFDSESIDRFIGGCFSPRPPKAVTELQLFTAIVFQRNVADRRHSIDNVPLVI